MTRPRRYARWLLIALLIAWTILLLWPVRNMFFRTGLITTLVSIVTVSLFLSWRKKWCRFSLLVAIALPTIFLLLPGRPIDKDQLRHTYLLSLRRYEGTRYVWGGETWLGVDCSGLLRAALVDACAWEAVAQANPALVREAFSLWWHDTSAREMSQGYAGRCIILAPPLHLTDANDLMKPGDIAVTSDGSHVIARLEKETWIQADPATTKVMEFEEAGWWDQAKVIPCRWNLF